MLSQSDARKYVRTVDSFDIDSVIELFENATGGLFNARTGFVDILYPESLIKLYTTLRPISSVTKIEELVSGTWYELDSDDYTVTENYIFKNTLAEWEYPTRVTLDGGWSETTSPSAIRKGLALQIAFEKARMDGEKIDVNAKAIAAGATTEYLEAGMHPYFKKVVDQYRRYIA